MKIIETTIIEYETILAWIYVPWLDALISLITVDYIVSIIITNI